MSGRKWSNRIHGLGKRIEITESPINFPILFGSTGENHFLSLGLYEEPDIHRSKDQNILVRVQKSGNVKMIRIEKVKIVISTEEYVKNAKQSRILLSQEANQFELVVAGERKPTTVFLLAANPTAWGLRPIYYQNYTYWDLDPDKVKGRLILEAEIIFRTPWGQSENPCSCPLHPFDQTNHTESLSNDLAKHFNQSESADVVFQVGAEKIPAHKWILRLRVPHFDRMFAAGMTETASNTVNVVDATADVFRKVLKFVYSGQLPEDFPSVAAEMLPIADKYGMEELKNSGNESRQGRRCRNSHSRRHLQMREAKEGVPSESKRSLRIVKKGRAGTTS